MGSSGTATNAVGSGTTMAAGNTAPSNSGTGGQAEKTSTGVQRLLDTEREANRLVLEARQCELILNH